MSDPMREALTGALKWIRRIRDRQDDLPKSFLDGCDPAPLVQEIENVLARPISTTRLLSPQPKFDSRPGRGWWAPGEYINYCRRCKDPFVGDKRAGICADCAYEPASGSLCGTCKRAGVSCPIWEPGFRVRECVEYRKTGADR